MKGENYSGKRIAVWFSCGAASAVAAYITNRAYPSADVRFLYTHVADEHPDNLRFLKDMENVLDNQIHILKSKKYPSGRCADVWEDKKFMSSPYGAPCTTQLKKEVRRDWEGKYKPDYHVFGFTYDEKKRHEMFVKTERSNVIPVLINSKITKQGCVDYLEKLGVRLPEMYHLGYPNANCIGCVKATSPTYWNKVRETHPEVFNERAIQSRSIGCRLVRYKGNRIFLDDLPPDAVGAQLKSLKFSCGVVCEEYEEQLPQGATEDGEW